ncbi:hypothetical protein, partial [Noviherbaspirillum sp.]|uniref:hypothetical protein n=1 Tax=Noviherbaspirillum sp. TaxID=1926288 RepID=UPI002FE3FA1C
FGTIEQLIAEDRPDAETREHADFCRKIGLPICFADMEAANISEAELVAIAQKTCAAPYIGHLHPPADVTRVVDCLRRADRMGASFAQR